MSVFEEKFRKSSGQPIEHGGMILKLSDFFPADGFHKFRVVFESCSSDWRQAVVLRLVFRDKNGKWHKGVAKGKGNTGQFILDGKASSGADGLALWQNPNRDTFEFEVPDHSSVIHVYNAWDCGDGVVHAAHNGAAMIVEEIGNGRRYRCNDGIADEDFDDIVFRLERVN